MHNFMLLIDKLQFFKRIINFNENKQLILFTKTSCYKKKNTKSSSNSLCTPTYIKERQLLSTAWTIWIKLKG